MGILFSLEPFNIFNPSKATIGDMHFKLQRILPSYSLLLRQFGFSSNASVSSGHRFSITWHNMIPYHHHHTVGHLVAGSLKFRLFLGAHLTTKSGPFYRKQRLLFGILVCCSHQFMFTSCMLSKIGLTLPAQKRLKKTSMRYNVFQHTADQKSTLI